jgi:UDP-N-acetyl-D-mannosaminuronic acid transferase (WecB/TagA/CpsF family)
VDGGSIPVILDLLAEWDKVEAAAIDDSESSRRPQQRIRGYTMPNQDVEQKANEVLQKLSPEDANLIIQATVTKVLDQIKDRVFRQAFDSAQQVLGDSDNMIVAVDDLAKKTGDTKEDILFKALALYEAAIDAKQKGQRLVLLGSDYRFIKEIIGFEQMKPESRQPESVAG